jgi:hypothetical protein
MAIGAPVTSQQYAAQSGSPYNPGQNPGTPLYELVAHLIFTAAGVTSAAAGDIALLRLPPGRIRIRPDLSKIVCPQATVNSDLDIGVAAYTKSDGTTQSASNNALADSLDVGGGALNQALTLPASGGLVVDSKNGADVVCSFDTANSPASGLLAISIVYQRE